MKKYTLNLEKKVKIVLLILSLILLWLILFGIWNYRRHKDMFSYKPDDTVKIIFDTDLDSDVDDVGALAVLYSYAIEGRARILATVGSCNRGYAVKCLSGINSYFGFSDVPVGVTDASLCNDKSQYQKIIGTIYGYEAPDDTKARSALGVYRETLASAEDHSVVVIIDGSLNNLADLLQSGGDEYSSLSGIELVRDKVKLCVVMGGTFPENTESATIEEEHNIGLDPDAAYYVTHYCPVSVLWCGYEIGDSIFSGDTRNDMEEDNPVRLAYDLYGKDYTGSFSRKSYDLVTVAYALEGDGEYWNVLPGVVEINTSDGIIDKEKGPAYIKWMADSEAKDAILKMKVSPKLVSVYLNQRMVMARKNSNILLDENISIGDARLVFHELAVNAGVDDSRIVKEEYFLDDLTAGSLAQLMYDYAVAIGSAERGLDSWWWAVNNGFFVDNSITINTVLKRGAFVIALRKFYTSVLLWPSS